MPDSSLGARLSASEAAFRVWAPRATRVELWVYAAPFDAAPAVTAVMAADGAGAYAVALKRSDLTKKRLETLYYGFRA